MKSAQIIWREDSWQNLSTATRLDSDSTLVMAFGTQHSQAFNQLHQAMPQSKILGCSTAGEMLDNTILDDSLVATVVAFEKSRIEQVCDSISTFSGDSFELGKSLSEQLVSLGDDLKHVFVLSDGLLINGGYLVEGFRSVLPSDVQVTGGLAGDGEHFSRTFVTSGVKTESGAVVALGLYGESLDIRFGSRGGWCPFGMERKVTQAKDNVLYELDDQNALDIYKAYLGDLADELPASGLRFPLEITLPEKNLKLVRTLLATNENDGTITFAGNIPKGVSAKLMRASSDSLIDGARLAASLCHDEENQAPTVAILISCVGRKLLLRQLAEDEVEAVHHELGENVVICGFYSYGEIAPIDKNGKSELHNQTMTITTLREL
ncbi:FIST C-terminal domain-containing protein [Vibrio vulnificus]|nr:FIST C-terminal domain-containing protein [Vibrio vulnificus]